MTERPPRITEGAALRLDPWPEGDPPIAPPLVGSPRMVRYLAHINEPAIVAERQAHFDDHRPRHFRIVDGQTGEPVGWMAYWDRFWNGELALEMGWAVLPGFQRQDLSAAAFEAIATARSEGRARVLLATPSVDDGLANATCLRTGFSLIDTRDIELADGSAVSCNVWRQDLT